MMNRVEWLLVDKLQMESYADGMTAMSGLRMTLGYYSNSFGRVQYLLGSFLWKCSLCRSSPAYHDVMHCAAGK